MIYLDNAATTFPKPECVYQAMDKANRELAFNAGRGSYKAARDAAAIIDETKSRIANILNASGYADVVFTPSVTHAFNQVLYGLDTSSETVIYVSPYEHNAVARTAYAVSKQSGAQIEQLPLSKNLQIDVERTEYLFSIKKPAVVVLNALSNVTGYVTPVKEIFSLAKRYGAITALDAAQAAGLLDLDMQMLQADIICFAAHKTLCGPLGIGGFAIKHGITLKKTFVGGTGSNSLNLDMPDFAPERYEAASQNIVAISGLLASLKELNVQSHREKVQKLTDYLLSRLEEIPSVQVLGAYRNGLTLGIVSFIVEGYQSDEVGSILDEEFDIAVRTGFHCAPFIHAHLMDVPYNGTIRIGLSQFNTEDDVDALISALESL